MQPESWFDSLYRDSEIANSRHVARPDERRPPKAKDAGSSPAVTTEGGAQGWAIGLENRAKAHALMVRLLHLPPSLTQRGALAARVAHNGRPFDSARCNQSGECK